MGNNKRDKISIIKRLSVLREKYLPFNEVLLRRLALCATVMYTLIIIWALVFKMCNENILRNLYMNLKDMTLKERILWDIKPFNYRGEGDYRLRIILDTVLNCFVFAPFGVLLCYIFKKINIVRDAIICLALSIGIEAIQLITMLGNPATEDLITNTLGYFIGLGIYMLLFRRLSTKSGVIVALVVNFILAAVVLYSLISFAGAADLIFKIVTKVL
jgi:glycopeptide antibiotics resistance protein